MNELTRHIQLATGKRSVHYELPEGWELRDDLKQSDYVRWERMYNANPSKGKKTDYGVIVQTSIKQKWFDECPVEAKEVGTLSPREISQVAIFVNAVYEDAEYVPDFLS